MTRSLFDISTAPTCSASLLTNAPVVERHADGRLSITLRDMQGHSDPEDTHDVLEVVELHTHPLAMLATKAQVFLVPRDALPHDAPPSASLPRYEGILLSPGAGRNAEGLEVGLWLRQAPLLKRGPDGSLRIALSNDAPENEWYIVRNVVPEHVQKLIMVATDLEVFVMTVDEYTAQLAG